MRLRRVLLSASLELLRKLAFVGRWVWLSENLGYLIFHLDRRGLLSILQFAAQIRTARCWNIRSCHPRAIFSRVFPLRGNRHLLGALSLDVKSAHKRVVLSESERRLVGFSHLGQLYFYRVCPFGAKFSAHWWGRVGSFLIRALHVLVWVQHSLLLFVDDFLHIQRLDVLPLYGAMLCLFFQIFDVPLSWKRLEFGCQVDWIGWRFNFSQGVAIVQPAKRDKFIALVTHLLSRSRTTRKDIEKFVGLALWITQLFPCMRSMLHYLYADLSRPPASHYSAGLDHWLQLVERISDNLIFKSTPPGTAIPTGSKLLAIRHHAVHSLQDALNIQFSDRRIWLRILDFGSSKRRLSSDSLRVLRTYSHWMRYGSPQSSLYPRPAWVGTAAADASAAGSSAQIGGFTQAPSGEVLWYSETFCPSDFSSLGVSVSENMQRDIGCYEALAQAALLLLLARLYPSSRAPVQLRSLCDNTSAEAGANKLFTTAMPLALFLEKIALISAMYQIQLDVTHVAGERNEYADCISRWPVKPFPPFCLDQNRVRLTVSDLWVPTPRAQLFPEGSSLLWFPF